MTRTWIGFVMALGAVGGCTNATIGGVRDALVDTDAGLDAVDVVDSVDERTIDAPAESIDASLTCSAVTTFDCPLYVARQLCPEGSTNCSICPQGELGCGVDAGWMVVGQGNCRCPPPMNGFADVACNGAPPGAPLCNSSHHADTPLDTARMLCPPGATNCTVCLQWTHTCVQDDTFLVYSEGACRCPPPMTPMIDASACEGG